MQPSIYLNLLYSIHGAYQQKREFFLYTYALRYCLVARMNIGIGWNEIKIGNPYWGMDHSYGLHIPSSYKKEWWLNWFWKIKHYITYKCHQGKNETENQPVHDYEKVCFWSLIQPRNTQSQYMKIIQATKMGRHYHILLLKKIGFRQRSKNLMNPKSNPGFFLNVTSEIGLAWTPL